MAEYLEDKRWSDGIEEVVRREGPGVEVIQRIFGKPPTCWGQGGGSWGPQVHPAMKRLGVPAIVYPATFAPSSKECYDISGGQRRFNGHRHKGADQVSDGMGDEGVGSADVSIDELGFGCVGDVRDQGQGQGLGGGQGVGVQEHTALNYQEDVLDRFGRSLLEKVVLQGCVRTRLQSP